jgi:hypothetical protein
MISNSGCISQLTLQSSSESSIKSSCESTVETGLDLNFKSKNNSKNRNKKRIRDFESHARGDECENKVKAFLEENDIPYWMNLRVKIDHLNVTEFDFIIPGASIECKYGFRKCRITDIAKQTKTQLELTNDTMLYIYILHAESSQLETLDAYLSKVIANKKRVKIISNLDILLTHKTNFSYIIFEKNMLYPFLHTSKIKNNLDKLYSDIPSNSTSTLTQSPSVNSTSNYEVPISYVERIEYYKLKLIVDEEDELFNNHKIILFDKNKIDLSKILNKTLDEYKHIYSMTNNVSVIIKSKISNYKGIVSSIDNLNYIFKVFHKFLPPDPVFMSNKYPNKLVENISVLCPCEQHYVFVNSKNYYKCNNTKQISKFIHNSITENYSLKTKKVDDKVEHEVIQEENYEKSKKKLKTINKEICDT